MQKLLISSCLFGNPVRYNGTALALELQTLKQHFELLPYCPEVSAGLPIPRPPAEIIYRQKHDPTLVIQDDGLDVTDAFMHGAKLTLKFCQTHHIKLALLTEFSPSCGSTEIYDGTFSGSKVSGQGVTAQLLNQHGVKVFNQFNINALIERVTRA